MPWQQHLSHLQPNHPRLTVKASSSLELHTCSDLVVEMSTPGVASSSISDPSGGSRSVIKEDQLAGLEGIRLFLKSKTSYDVLPVSFKLVVLDTTLLVKKSLTILLQNNIVSAPLWDSKASRYAGLLTASDYINVIQYYFQHPDKLDKVEDFTLDGLREVEKAIGADPIETISIHPFSSLYEACGKMIEAKARRIPLIDVEEDSQREIVVSVLTHYRILKFVALNCLKETRLLQKPLSELHIGVYENISTCSMTTPVIDVIHILASKRVSSVPILDDEGKLVNAYEAVDVLTLIKGGIYTDLSLSVGEALMRRPEDFEGVYICTENDKLDTIMDIVRKTRIHRLFVVDNDGRLKGIVTLSDILKYLLYGESTTTN